MFVGQHLIASKKLRTHIKEQHGKEEEDTPPSPARKSQKPDNLDQRIEDNANLVADEQSESGTNTEEEGEKMHEDEPEQNHEDKPKEEEIKELKSRITNGNLRLLQLEADCKFLREETTLEIDNLNKINSQSKAKILELTCIIRQKDAEIEAEAKTTTHKVNQLQVTLLEQIKTIENQNKEIENYKSPRPTLKATPVEKASNHTADNTAEYSIKCKECNFTGRTMNDVKEHKRTECSEALIQRLIEEDSESRGTGVREEEAALEGGEHPPVQVDECIQNVSCEGDCQHKSCGNRITQKSEEHKVTCNSCKQKFRDKNTMMDHKRDSDHPSKHKCNKFPECERGDQCWYVHGKQIVQQGTHRKAQENPTFACNVCEQVFTDRNIMMFHKKRVHPSNIMCSNFLNGYCRRGISGEFCWYKHEAQHTPAPNVARPPNILPPPGSPSWDTDFPPHPTMGQSPMVGMKQQVLVILQQQRQEQQIQQQKHQQQMAVMMNQLMNLNV